MKVSKFVANCQVAEDCKSTNFILQTLSLHSILFSPLLNKLVAQTYVVPNYFSEHMCTIFRNVSTVCVS